MELNHRQKSLYKYLQNKSPENRFITKEEICADLPELYDRGNETTSEHNSNVYSKIREDVAMINQSDMGMIITSSRKGYKIGNQKQTKSYLNRYQMKHLRGLKRYWKMLKKAQENGQLAMTEDGLVEMRRMLEELDGGQ